MNFWATRLAGQAPQAPVQAPPVPVQVAGAWFANPLLNGLQAAPQAFVPTESAREELVSVQTQKPLASRNAGTCPSCGGDNYGRTGTASNYERCYECGYNSRFEQAMSGAGIPTGSEGPSSPSRQVSSGGGHGSINNFHPEIIVAKHGL